MAMRQEIRGGSVGRRRPRRRAPPRAAAPHRDNVMLAAYSTPTYAQLGFTANCYHTLHAFSRTIGAFWPQWKARWNSGMFETMPLMRCLPGECGLVIALARRFSGVWALQAHCANPMKKRWSGVKPSIGWFSFGSAAFQAM